MYLYDIIYTENMYKDDCDKGHAYNIILYYNIL